MPDIGKSDTATPVKPIDPVTQSDFKHYQDRLNG